MTPYTDAHLAVIASFQANKPSSHARRLDEIYERLDLVIDQFGSFESFDEAISETSAPEFAPAQQWAGEPWLIRNLFMADLGYVCAYEDPRLDLFIHYAARAIRSANTNFEANMFRPDTSRVGFRQQTSAFEAFSFLGKSDECRRLAVDYDLVYPAGELLAELKAYRNDSADRFMNAVTRLEAQRYEALASIKEKLSVNLDILSLEDPRRTYLIGEAVSDRECAQRLSNAIGAITASPMKMQEPPAGDLVLAIKRNPGYVEFGLDADLYKTLSMGYNMSLIEKNPAGAIDTMIGLFKSLQEVGGHPVACVYAIMKGSWASAARAGFTNQEAMAPTVIPESTRLSLLRDLYECAAAACLPYEALKHAQLSDKKFKVMHQLTGDDRYVSLIKSNEVKRDLIESEFSL